MSAWDNWPNDYYPEILDGDPTPHETDARGDVDFSLEEARAAIWRERETRHWSIGQWRRAALVDGREDWPAYSAEVTIAADEAVDALLAQAEEATA